MIDINDILESVYKWRVTRLINVAGGEVSQTRGFTVVLLMGM